MKITFRDTSATQYDDNAIEINIKTNITKDLGKLYIGDKLSATYVQLKHRDCTVVVNCSRPLHGFSKEPDVEYLNIDPISVEDHEQINEMWHNSYIFIKNAIKNQKNVLVSCENGSGKSAVIMIHYLMKRYKMSLGCSYEYIQDLVSDLKVRPQLMKKLIELDVKYNNVASMSIKNKTEYIVNSNATSNKNFNGKSKSNSSKFYYIGIIIVVVALGAWLYLWNNNNNAGIGTGTKSKSKSYASYSKSKRNSFKNAL